MELFPFDINTANKQQLIHSINHLINTDFNKLVFILYRLDVSEQHLKSLLASNATTDAASIIADLIIQREQAKQQTRNLFTDSDQIPEAEKW